MSAKQVEHEITVRAPAKVVYELIAGADNWPQLFPPTVHVEILERTESDERIQIWATANGEPKTWTSRRVLDPGGLRIDFRQERSQPPVGGMGGAWVIEPLAEKESRVRLLHDYHAVDDDPENLDWIDKAVDRNSTSELAALRANAELLAGSSELLLTFEDSVRVAGSGKDVFDFIDQAQLWTERLPHVAKVSLREDTPGLQVLAMDTMTKDGSVHTTESVRVTFPHQKIVYKQTTMPPLMTLHTGQWLISEVSGGTEVVSQHTVVVNPSAIEQVLGTGATIAEARTFLRTALGGNSLTTLHHAKEYAEKSG